ncbi:hypothetical protein SAMN05421760_103209 [Neptunomonas antarctica]|uniref:Uncharacterized protein n=1 Tax=Neptunomonas antarctica TaxID=619304 RepID=A0A1N7L476_9GAMM|nr:hypothetical protein SAMN05421760_103209 [Neptunomonas antarctica]
MSLHNVELINNEQNNFLLTLLIVIIICVNMFWLVS